MEDTTTGRKLFSALAALVMILGAAVSLAPAANAATCNTYTTRSSTWATASWCMRVDSRGYEWFRFSIDDTSEDGYCVYLATALNGRWLQETNAKSCGPVVSNEFVYHVGSTDDRFLWGVRVYRQNGNYYTLCDGPSAPVTGVPECSR